MTATQPDPWWTDTGPDLCEFCFAEYYAEVGYYCADCDRAVCPVCALAVFARQTVVCPQCDEEGER